MATVWIARNPGNWSTVSITARRPEWSARNLWSMTGKGFEVSTTAFEAIFGWLPVPGSLHQAELDLRVLEREGGGGKA